MNTEEYRIQVDERAGQIIDTIVERGGGGIWGAHALMERDVQQDKIVDIVKAGLGVTTPDGAPAGGPFHTLPSMLLLCRWESKLPDEAIDIIHALMAQGVLSRGNTENHWLMYYTGCLLAAERWPDQEENWNGLPPEAMRAEAMRWILGMIERTAVNGHHEYDSPQYHIEHMMSYIALADHAKDDHFREQVKKMLSLLIADMALEYFNGAWAGGHSREGYRENTWKRSGAIGILQYLYFGGEPFDPDHHTNGFGVAATTASYRPPPVFADIAWDRSEAHIVRKTKPPRTIYRCVDREAAPVYKYTYMSRNFALGSSQIGLPGPSAAPIDLISWDLTWDAPIHECKITCNHPYRDPNRFSAFLAGLPQQIRRSIASDKPYLQWEDRLFGASPYEQMMQHEGTTVILYQIPADDEAPYANLFLPRSIPWVERDGWIMGDMGSFYTAVRPIGVYDWQEIREAGTVRFQSWGAFQVVGWLLRLQDLNTGVIVEAVEADEAGPFEDFCNKRSSAHLDLSRWSDPGAVSVDTITGHRLEITYNGKHTVDGEEIDYSSYPLYDAPSAKGDVGTGKMTFSHGENVTELDFGVNAESPLMPMRVIG
jgi:hypothetical protein